MKKINKKFIKYINIIAGSAYILYVFYKVEMEAGYINAFLSACPFAVLFLTYNPIRNFLLKHFEEKKVYIFLTLPFVIVFFIFHELILG